MLMSPVPIEPPRDIQFCPECAALVAPMPAQCGGHEVVRVVSDLVARCVPEAEVPSGQAPTKQDGWVPEKIAVSKRGNSHRNLEGMRDCTLQSRHNC